MIMRHGILLLAIVVAVSAEPSSTASLDLATQAHRLRLDLAREASEWTGERQRLAALIAATEAETERVQREAAAAELARTAAEARLAALGTGSEVDALRLRLSTAGAALARDLADLAARLPPGAVIAPSAQGGEAGFDAAVRALEAAERAAGVVAVEVVTGRRGGRQEAVKLLRVAGAAAWWLSLDGLASGTLRMGAEGAELTATGDAAVHAAVIAAFAQAEGRSAPAIALLPGGEP